MLILKNYINNKIKNEKKIIGKSIFFSPNINKMSLIKFRIE